MTSSYLVTAATFALAACTQDSSANSQETKPESCADVEKARAAFRQKAKQSFEKLKADLGIDSSNPKVEHYPKLQDAEKLLEFQGELEVAENAFAIRLRGCSKID